MRPGTVLLVLQHAPDDRVVEVEAEVLQALGPHGGPPFLVRWADTGRVGLFGPDSDAFFARNRSTPAVVYPRGDPRPFHGNRA